MKERSLMIEWLRSEIVGPARPLSKPDVASFANKEFCDEMASRRGPLVWQPGHDANLEEVLYFDRESPHRKYGVGLLHPTAAVISAEATSPEEVALQSFDTIGADLEEDESESVNQGEPDNAAADIRNTDDPDDFEVTSPDLRRPSTMGVSFCVKLESEGNIVIRLPRFVRFSWQSEDNQPFLLNGRYECCDRICKDESGQELKNPIWRRYPAVLKDCEIVISKNQLTHGNPVRRDVAVPEDCPIKLCIEVFPRYRAVEDEWLLTVILRNATKVDSRQKEHESILYQSYFEVFVKDGLLTKYPESQRPFDKLDQEEQSLALLYRESATWGIGHGCACGWEADPGQSPSLLFADIMPAVELPSMTPDIVDAHGNRLELSMRNLANLPDDGCGSSWDSLDGLASEYAEWIKQRQQQINDKPDSQFYEVANRHLVECSKSLERIKAGISLIRKNKRIRQAFRLANLAMLLQQIATKQIKKRPLGWDRSIHRVLPVGDFQSPWNIYKNENENPSLGKWRAFQIAFLLMSLDGVRDGKSPDREIVDLIWFPTGGGKTEAYLAVMAFYMFHQRLLMDCGEDERQRDGTNVLMRYTLRMLTTQQFQRAASLICAMEFLRRNCDKHLIVLDIPGKRFSLGLWIGGQGSPNKIDHAQTELRKYRSEKIKGNPLVLSECPWCRSQIGRFDGQRPRGFTDNQWRVARIKGITEVHGEGPLLHCPDGRCLFGEERFQNWLPVEVIDERIYKNPPSLVIGTADKLAIIAYRPDAGALFGRRFANSQAEQYAYPPGIIVQDELHLISGPLGTMYALYEGIIERLCSFQIEGELIKPKLIASTATIRGAAEQIKSLYARSNMCLFPSPGLEMSDSFFGRYARDDSGRLRHGRLYLGIHASDYGSILTTQVRCFSSVLFRPFEFQDENSRDPWWTLLAFYNSIRELGGAKTLFDSDIRSRLKFMFNREGYNHDNRRNIRIVEEMTSRLSQAEIVEMMDNLSNNYPGAANSQVFDACLASNIIEVGVDIDRLSLMGVVGQPKTTATYIQVTGRVGRRWWERPGLIMTVYNPGKSRDRSHYEQFHSYHRRLYERVEPTSATPFALSAIQRALPGALITWARQQSDAPVHSVADYSDAIETGFQLLKERCELIQNHEDISRSLKEMENVRNMLMDKWGRNPQEWENLPQSVHGEYLMLWPGQFSTFLQQQNGVMVPSSMRQVDRTAELRINQGYVLP